MVVICKKNIAGLSPAKSVTTLVHVDRIYSYGEFANLFNNKFIAVGTSLPSLEWTPLPVNDFPPEFHISVEDTEKALLSAKLFSAAGPDELLS